MQNVQPNSDVRWAPGSRRHIRILLAAGLIAVLGFLISPQAADRQEFFGPTFRIQATAGSFNRDPALDLSQDSENPPLCPEPIRFVLHDLPPQSQVIIGSLDVTAKLHRIRLQAESDGPEMDASDTADQGGQRNSRFDQFQSLRGNNLPTSTRRPFGPDTKGLASPYCDASPRGDSRQSCDPVCVAPSGPRGANRIFLVPSFSEDAVHNEIRSGRHVHAGELVDVYWCDFALTEFSGKAAATDVSESAIRAEAAFICAVLEQRVLPRVYQLLGTISDIDHSEKLTIVLAALDSQERLHEFPVRGCVRPTDLLSPANPGAGDIVYLDPRPELDALSGQDAIETARDKEIGGEKPDAELVALLAHEVAHAAVYSRILEHRLRKHSTLSDACEDQLPAWLNEAIAHSVERELVPESRNFARRLSHFRSATESCPVFSPADVIPFAQRRRGPRAAATLFLQSISPESQGLRSLTEIDKPLLMRIERLAGQPFCDAFRNFCIAEVVAQTSASKDPEVSNAAAVPAVNDESVNQISGDSSRFISLRGTAMIHVPVRTGLRRLVIEVNPAARLQVTALTRDFRAVVCREEERPLVSR